MNSYMNIHETENTLWGNLTSDNLRCIQTICGHAHIYITMYVYIHAVNIPVYIYSSFLNLITDCNLIFFKKEILSVADAREPIKIGSQCFWNKSPGSPLLTNLEIYYTFNWIYNQIPLLIGSYLMALWLHSVHYLLVL